MVREPQNGCESPTKNTAELAARRAQLPLILALHLYGVIALGKTRRVPVLPEFERALSSLIHSLGRRYELSADLPLFLLKDQPEVPANNRRRKTAFENATLSQPRFQTARSRPAMRRHGHR